MVKNMKLAVEDSLPSEVQLSTPYITPSKVQRIVRVFGVIM